MRLLHVKSPMRSECCSHACSKQLGSFISSDAQRGLLYLVRVCVCVCGVKNQGGFVEIVRKEKLKSLRGVCRRQ